MKVLMCNTLVVAAVLGTPSKVAHAVCAPTQGVEMSWNFMFILSNSATLFNGIQNRFVTVSKIQFRITRFLSTLYLQAVIRYRHLTEPLMEAAYQLKGTMLKSLPTACRMVLASARVY